MSEKDGGDKPDSPKLRLIRPGDPADDSNSGKDDKVEEIIKTDGKAVCKMLQEVAPGVSTDGIEKQLQNINEYLRWQARSVEYMVDDDPQPSEDAERYWTTHPNLIREAFIRRWDRYSTLRANEMPDIGALKAAHILRQETGYDLLAARDQNVRLHEKWGFLDILKKKIGVCNAREYAARFDDCLFTRTGLRKIIEAIKSGEKWLPIFNPGCLGFSEIMELFGQKQSTVSRNFEKSARRIDPRPLKGLTCPDDHLLNENLIERELVELHQKGDPPTGRCFSDDFMRIPRISFTEDRPKPFSRYGSGRWWNEPNHEPLSISSSHRRFGSYRQCLEAARYGVRFIDPVSDLIRLRTQLQNASLSKQLRPSEYPDRFNGSTFYPLFVNAEGQIASLSCKYSGTGFELTRNDLRKMHGVDVNLYYREATEIDKCDAGGPRIVLA